MVSKHLNFSNTSLILFSTILFLSHPSLATITTSNASTLNNMWHEAICNSTPHPSECLTNLPQNYSGNTRDIARFFVLKSLAIATDFISLIDSYLVVNQSRPSLPGSTILALQDCRLLAELSLESMARTHRAINLTSHLGALEAEDLTTSLSAVLTNQETCLEGLGEVEAPLNVTRALGIPISLGTKLYSISLALFKQGWACNVYDNDDDDDDDDDDHDNMVTRQRKLLRAVVEGGVFVSQTVVVDRNGTGNFTTIGDAVSAAPNNTATANRGSVNSVNNSGTYFVIRVVRGVYEEYVSIGRNKQNLMLIGDGINQTVITGNRSVGDGWTTFHSATFAVTGQGFVAINITFRNTAGAVKRQAVAVRNGADLSAFHGCSFEGYQDTLYTHSLRQFYSDCHISGTVDFIFGNAAAVLQRCLLIPRLPLPGQFNAITAQGRSDPNQNTGTSLHACQVQAGPDLAFPGPNRTAVRTFLGRPWREYSRTVFMQTFMDGSVDPAGWREWNGSFALATLYYAEFNNTGPGSNTTARVTWPGYRPVIPVSDALNFTVSNFIAGDAWLAQTTAVPFTAGLLV